MLEDKLLVGRFNHGDADALRRIYQKYKNDLLKVAAALLNDRSAVEDVVHDVFVSFAQTAGRFQLTGSLKGYLSICIANRARDRNRAAQQLTVALNDDDEQSLLCDTTAPDHSARRSELFEKLKLAMAQLPYEQRETIVLYLKGGTKFRQIATSQGVSVNTVQSRYRYGLKKLRSIMTDESEK